MKDILKLLFYLTLAMLLMFLLAYGLIEICLAFNPSDRELITARKTRHYQKTTEGVEYFETCINGQLFYATRTNRVYAALAGPVGECD